MFRERIRRIHFVGIGGIGMSGIAHVLLDMGYEVSGSDLKENKNIQLLKEKGCKVYIGHREENVGDAQVVVYSSAVPKDNPEIVKARSLGIPVIPRGEMLAELFKLMEGIAVCGSHGKTTTTSMIAHVVHEHGFDPTVIIGGILQRFGSNAKLGKDKLIISEADESDGSFLKILPTVAVITNIDKEHIGYYRDLEDIKEAFFKFAESVPFYGFCVVNVDDENSRHIVEGCSKRVVTYGIERDAQVMARDLKLSDGCYSYELVVEGRAWGRVKLSVPGLHNVYNSLASVCVAWQMGIDFDTIAKALSTFKNAERRLELKGFYRNVPVYDDYGHHPTEIKATLKAIKDLYPDKKLLLVFQPHRYSRTYHLFEDFAKVLRQADECVLTDIYPAGEENTYGVSGEELAKKSGCLFVRDKAELFEYLKDRVNDAHVLLFMGAGPIGRWCEEFLNEGNIG
ncbi:UDP-N-acetylmuramate--L-alanine ligase [Thermocrinis minervae]|uniref:UDP-N-acetylmuramate--L-alanine ligase n=1 Tax=Thermocrinis minervae TaxID=381751 RepID=A0A1M6T177_9AQUI|nr:UDP-N-acetylmuramate--L-alanine ligase [Thermocrinis minervae]SHK50669.1 UDP-N-acetylmuramate--L-alanine ligase [Thermocrinis minervae]